MKARFDITKGPDMGRSFELEDGQTLTVGRGDEAGVQMLDGLISREHCEFCLCEQRLYLKDLGSTNHTFIPPNLTDPIAAHEVYELVDGASVFIGPESRLTIKLVSLETPPPRATPIEPSRPNPVASPASPPAHSPPPSAGGNFTSSLAQDAGHREFGESVMHNLLGPSPSSPGITNSVFGTPGLSQGRSPDPAPKLRTNAPTNLHSNPPATSHPSPSTGSRPGQPATSAFDGSIAPPHLQGIDAPIIREQVGADQNSRDEQLSSTPSISDGETANDLPHGKASPSPAASPAGQGPLDSIAGGTGDSIAAPGGLGRPTHSPPPGPTNRRSNVTPAASPQAPPPASTSAFTNSVAFNSSIALPGVVPQQRDPAVTRVALPPNDTPPFSDSIAAPVPGGKTDQPETAPGESSDSVTPIDVPAPSHQQPNGLFFHTGEDPASVADVIAAIGEFVPELQPLYCVDLTRLELPEAENTAPPADVATEGAAEKPSGKPADKGQPQQDPSAIQHTSAFDLDDDAGDGSDSPFASIDAPVAAEPVAPLADETDEVAPHAGTPLFEFLPPDLQHNGPLLMTADEFDIPLDIAWHNDALVIFFGDDVDALKNHLRELLHMNIQSGRPSKGMFGFCWPTVFHSMLESQPGGAVARIFGDNVACVLMEDPQHRFAWNAIAREDMTNCLEGVMARG